MINSEKIKEKLKDFIPLAIGAAGLCLFYLLVGCPTRVFLGVTCPGCGMSRALEAMLRLDFALAASCHPLVFFLPIAGIVFLFRKKIPPKIMCALIAVAGIALTAVYIYRLVTGSEIVYIDFTRGKIYEFLQGIG